MQPSHAEDDRLHNSDVAMEQAKLARYQLSLKLLYIQSREYRELMVQKVTFEKSFQH